MELQSRGVAAGPLGERLAINYQNNLDDRLVNRLELIYGLIEKLESAYKRSNELEIQGALLRIRSHAMSASSLFSSIADDIETLLQSGEWQGFPEDYRFPE